MVTKVRESDIFESFGSETTVRKHTPAMILKAAGKNMEYWKGQVETSNNMGNVYLFISYKGQPTGNKQIIKQKNTRTCSPSVSSVRVDNCIGDVNTRQSFACFGFKMWCGEGQLQFSISPRNSNSLGHKWTFPRESFSIERE